MVSFPYWTFPRISNTESISNSGEDNTDVTSSGVLRQGFATAPWPRQTWLTRVVGEADNSWKTQIRPDKDMKQRLTEKIVVPSQAKKTKEVLN